MLIGASPPSPTHRAQAIGQTGCCACCCVNPRPRDRTAATQALETFFRFAKFSVGLVRRAVDSPSTTELILPTHLRECEATTHHRLSDSPFFAPIPEQIFKMADRGGAAPRGGAGFGSRGGDRGRGDRGRGRGRGRGRRGGKEDSKEWQPVTKLGRLVKAGKIKSMEEIYLHSLPIKEYQIVDFFLPKLKDEVMKVRSETATPAHPVRPATMRSRVASTLSAVCAARGALVRFAG